MAKNFIKGAIKHPGAERKAAAKAGMSTRSYMEKEKDAPGTAGKRARLGLELEGMHHPGRARGGPVQRGKPYTVGEQGPETFIPRLSGSIQPTVGAPGNMRNGVIRSPQPARAAIRGPVGPQGVNPGRAMMPKMPKPKGIRATPDFRQLMGKLTGRGRVG